MTVPTSNITVALDAMGGDHGPEVVLAGAELSRRRYPDLRFVIHGEEAATLPVLERYERLQAASTFVACETSITMDMKPSQALRKGRKVSGMWKALDSVKAEQAHVAVSAGNTGALMAMAKFCLRMMPGIERPALAAIWPTMRGQSIVLDVGATIGADAEALVDYALMGSAMARILLDHDRPSVGLLNIGVEEVKGLEQIRDAGTRLRELDLPGLDYAGFVEGDDLGKGTVDVVVTEGFTGNIALKTAEGTARQVGQYLRDAMGRTWSAKLGYFLARGAFGQLRERMDPRRVNGAVFLGLNGLVIKSHGGTDAEGIAAAIDLGQAMARQGLQKRIEQDLIVLKPETDPNPLTEEAENG